MLFKNHCGFLKELLSEQFLKKHFFINVKNFFFKVTNGKEPV